MFWAAASKGSQATGQDLGTAGKNWVAVEESKLDHDVKETRSFTIDFLGYFIL